MSPKQKRSSLPRPLAPDLSLGPPRYRAGMYVELQKFGDWKGARQMLLTEASQDRQELAEWKVTGLDLSVSQLKALSALQILLDKTDYQGNVPGQKADSKAFQWTGTLPRLAVTYPEYLEAYGLQKIGGKYQGRQRVEAIEALRSLVEAQRIAYVRKLWKCTGKKRKQVGQAIVHRGPLVTITEGYKELTEEETAQIQAGQDLPLRATHLVVGFSPLIVDGLQDGFYLLKPVTLHQEIKELLGSRRVPRAVHLFLEWLLTLNLPKMSIAKDKLAKVLRLDYLIKQRKRTLVNKRLQEAIQTALELEYLLDSQEDAFGTLHFTLNPDKMGRPPKWETKEEEEDEEAGSLPE